MPPIALRKKARHDTYVRNPPLHTPDQHSVRNPYAYGYIYTRYNTQAQAARIQARQDGRPETSPIGGTDTRPTSLCAQIARPEDHLAVPRGCQSPYQPVREISENSRPVTTCAFITPRYVARSTRIGKRGRTGLSGSSGVSMGSDFIRRSINNRQPCPSWHPAPSAVQAPLVAAIGRVDFQSASWGCTSSGCCQVQEG